MGNNEKIDVVFTWVNGNDPVLAKKRAEALGRDASLLADDIGGATRYASFDELAWSIASINKYLPWINKIYVITDNQHPTHELEYVNSLFPSPIPVEVVDHKVVFKGIEDVLPVFNSLSIETVMWRIPGLSEKFIYFNDDMFVMSPMLPEDWWEGDKIICHGHKFSLNKAKFLEHFRRYKGRRAIGFKTNMIAASDTLSENHFVYYYHTPVSLSKSLLSDYYEAHPEMLRINADHKFRAASQFSTQALSLLLAERAGQLILKRDNINLFLKPEASRTTYLTKRLEKANSNPNLKLGCISSLDRASDAQREEFKHWIEERLSPSVTNPDN